MHINSCSVTNAKGYLKSTLLENLSKLWQGICSNPMMPHSGARDRSNLIINYIPDELSSHTELRHLFGSCGEIIECNIPLDHNTGSSKGYAFIKFKNESSATLAIDTMDGLEVYGKRLKVSVAKGKKEQLPSNNGVVSGKPFSAYNPGFVGQYTKQPTMQSVQQPVVIIVVQQQPTQPTQPAPVQKPVEEKPVEEKPVEPNTLLPACVQNSFDDDQKSLEQILELVKEK